MAEGRVTRNVRIPRISTDEIQNGEGVLPGKGQTLSQR